MYSHMNWYWGMYRQKMVGKAIETFKDHFVAILREVGTAFLMNLWDQLHPQAEIDRAMWHQKF